MFLLQIFLADKESLEILLSSWQLTEKSQRKGQKKNPCKANKRKLWTVYRLARLYFRSRYFVSNLPDISVSLCVNGGGKKHHLPNGASSCSILHLKRERRRYH